MLKKIVLAGIIAVASLVSLNFGTRTTSVSIPTPANARANGPAKADYSPPICPPCGPYWSCC